MASDRGKNVLFSAIEHPPHLIKADLFNDMCWNPGAGGQVINLEIIVNDVLGHQFQGRQDPGVVVLVQSARRALAFGRFIESASRLMQVGAYQENLVETQVVGGLQGQVHDRSGIEAAKGHVFAETDVFASLAQERPVPDKRFLRVE